MIFLIYHLILNL